MMRQRGFTLIEAVVVMVVTSILAGVMVLFIRRPVQQYVESAERADMTDVADLALRRMARELHGALPNSVRYLSLSGGVMIEFIPTKAGGIYLDASDNAGSGHPLDFGPTASPSTQFTVVGDLSTLPTASDYIVVYNLGPGYASADAYSNTGGSMNRAAIAPAPALPTTTETVSWSATPATLINLASNPFALPVSATNQVPNASPSHRFQVVTQPVTFRCARQTPAGPVLLTRHWNYGFNASVTDPLGSGSSALLATNVASCSFSYLTAANIQHGLVGLAVTLNRATSTVNESVTLSQQVNVENTP